MGEPSMTAAQRELDLGLPERGERPWMDFCRALSAAGLPECLLPAAHDGAHVFGHVPSDTLFDRCAIMLRAPRFVAESPSTLRHCTTCGERFFSRDGMYGLMCPHCGRGQMLR